MKKLVFALLFLTISCEVPEDSEANKFPVVKGGEALEVSTTTMEKVVLDRLKVTCNGLSQYHDDIFRGVHNTTMSFTRKKKSYGSRELRTLTTAKAFIPMPRDYDSTPYFDVVGSSTDFMTTIEVENGNYFKHICDYLLDGIGSKPTIQYKSGAKYYVYSVYASDRIDVAEYTRHNDGKYYPFKVTKFVYDLNSDSSVYGMATSQEQVVFKDYRGSDQYILYQSLKR